MPNIPFLPLILGILIGLIFGGQLRALPVVRNLPAA